MDKMATMHLNGKNLRKSSTPEPLARLPWNLVCNIKWLRTTKFVLNGDPRLTMTYFFVKVKFSPLGF